jgi:hypothetical protein
MTARKKKRPVRPAVPPLAEQRIETERRRLQRAQEVLMVAIHASNHGAEFDAADLMSVVVDLIDVAVNALDSVQLAQPP